MAKELKDLIVQRVDLESLLRDGAEKYKEECASIEVELLEVLSRIADCVADGLASKPAPKKRAPPKKPKAPDHDATAKRYADFEPAEGGCLCGCGEDVAEGSSFVRGHQHKLRSIAGAVAAGKLDSDKISTMSEVYAISQGWMEGLA